MKIQIDFDNSNYSTVIILSESDYKKLEYCFRKRKVMTVYDTLIDFSKVSRVCTIKETTC